ncbi:GNAT family N-acetyltransferase [Tetragenococcus halophilus]|uniref:GNAT family N-acetyltransferase n=1 Tax=Tetragenococcus halophilus TaxID=51669 RepID=A0AB35HNG0_TETHA|nr:GNAT family N-acetyltransferase [Tetragenococcus halophilus]AOF48521.1 hypothetical protein AC806_03415 [Tetragenococcus halophilus]MCF1601559.1 GNAT family N-acetyltransferase [Tetragenococcus halophilus]MCF1676119.1 GNAT family N-acetyltransferase [Tetragenococcus halophilus]MCF1685543.1 GNAT family N-acetyltransferase [Tetragenococcus halophilus]MCO7027081.1 GNAT family N-acetyltransferase [Tetragenococcus halophilus]
MPKNRLTFHTVRGLDGELEQALKLFVETFKTEAITAHTYNFNHELTEKQYYKASLLNAKLYIEQGHDIMVAKIDDTIVGVSIMKKTSQKSLIHTLRFVFPEVFELLPLLTKIKYRNAFSMSKTMKLTHPLKENYVTLAAIAVTSNYQGKGVGKQFLNEIHQRYKKDFESIYLYTADEKNKNLYSHIGYEMVEHKQASHFSVYHMIYRF